MSIVITPPKPRIVITPPKTQLAVVRLTKQQCSEFVTKKHYSRRDPVFWEGFGLVEHNKIVGVCVYGQPSAPINKHSFKDRDFRLYELSRLVIQTHARNAASFLIANSLKMLSSQPCAVISYADSEQSHCGIVYQATNWIYTGATVSHDHLYLIDGQRVHPMNLRTQGITDPKRWAKDNNVQTIPPSPKHRYFQFVGNKRERKMMLAKLNYPIVSSYPKSDQRRYDDGPNIDMAALP